jgi:3,4-dihydroxy 2-butanone 4-phosphate synthase/GTP cyclohydrolase II
MAREGGVLVRTGHTEAAVDIARLAGLTPAGVICEIMNDDGTMARLPDLVSFAQRHNLKLGTIADLIAYRRRTEKLVKRVEEGFIPSRVGEPWRLIVYRSLVDNVEHIAMVKGDVTTPEPVMVRMHAVDTLMDVVGGEQLASLQGARNLIRKVGRGVIVLIREASPTAASDRIRALINGAKETKALRDSGIGAQILQDLGIKDMILLSNHKRTIVGLEAYGINIVEQREILAPEHDPG